MAISQERMGEIPGRLEPLNASMNELSVNAKPKKSKEDKITQEFSQILDTSKKKLSSLDTQRIIASIADASKKAEIVTLLPFVLENLDRYSVILGSNLVQVLNEYDKLQNDFTQLNAQIRKSRPGTAGSSHQASADSDEDLADLKSTAHALRTHLIAVVKTIIRLFRSNPTATNAISFERNERAFEANNFIDHLNSAKDQLFARLVTSPSEEREKQKALVQIFSREKKLQIQIKKLEDELSTATNEKNDEIQAKNEILRTNKLAIQNVEQDAEVVNRQLLTDAGKKQTLEMKNSEGRKGKLSQDVIKLKQQLQTNLTDHRESELSLRKRKFKIETEVENWIQKYDLEMTEKQDELDELVLIYNEEKKQLDQMEEKFGVLEADYKAIVEERRVAQEKREADEEEMRILIKAATLMQSFWRAYKCRKMLKAKLKKDKKKGKGKSGKKSGKR